MRRRSFCWSIPVTHRAGAICSGYDLSPAGSALRHRESIFQNTISSATSLRAQRFPSANSQTHTAAPGLRLGHSFVQLFIRRKAHLAVILLLQLLESFGLDCSHPSVQLPALIGRGRQRQDSTESVRLWPWLFNDPAVRSLRMICSGE